jgi:hypothetical protein
MLNTTLQRILIHVDTIFLRIFINAQYHLVEDVDPRRYHLPKNIYRIFTDAQHHLANYRMLIHVYTTFKRIFIDCPWF